MTPVTAGTLDATHAVLTPEYVEFDFVLAGLYSRFLAWVVDTVVVLMVSFVAVMVGGVISPFISIVVYFLIDWGYAIALEIAWSGQTVGKRMMGLRVIQESGVRIGFHQAVLRNIARPVDRLPALYLVGGVVALFSSSHQRLGDMLAGTVVIRERSLKLPSSLPGAEAQAGLLADPRFRTQAAKLPPEDQELIFSAAFRREELGMDARLKLFAALSRRMQDEFGFERPEYLSDEKLVLFIAAALSAEKTRLRTRR
jgi:uncharacterized RDD family membrane protein YckC